MAAPVGNAAFAPSPRAGPAHGSFEGRLEIAGGRLASACAALDQEFALGGAPRRFPSLALAFTSHRGELLPLWRGLHRRPDRASYWDVMVGPGRIWSEPGDGARSRAAFPFQLSNQGENDSHHGVACLLFDGEGVSGLVLQVTVETRPYDLPAGFDLWGRLAVSFTPGPGPGASHDAARGRAVAFHGAARGRAVAFYDAARGRAAERRGAPPIRPLDELRPAVGDRLLDALATGTGSDSEIVAGLACDGAIYASAVATRHGPFPYPRAMRFGLWSATKAAFATTALLRLAHRLGPEVATTRIADVIPAAAAHPHWQRVTIRHCLDMASGIGTAAGRAGAPDIHADNLTTPEDAAASPEAARSYRAYRDWFQAPSLAGKLAAAFACPSYPWGAGEVARYRDQDLFMAGIAMDALWKRRQGPDADLFAMVAEEVFAPIGIVGADIGRTVEADGRQGAPLGAFGLYLGIDDVARLGRLLAGGGVHRGQRLLEPTLLAACFDGRFDKGRATGTFTAEGREIAYSLACWQLPMTTRAGRQVRIATMRGYGGQIVQPLWNGIVCFRFACDPPHPDRSYDALKLPRIADALKPL